MSEMAAAQPRFVCVFRAASAVRVRPDESIMLNFTDADVVTQVVVRTRYEPVASGVIPRELWVEIVTSGQDLTDAIDKAHQRAASVVAILSLIVNAGTDNLVLDRAFHASPERDDHEYLQNMILDETGLPKASRIVTDRFPPKILTALSTHARQDRLLRAIGQYELALRHWVPGHETLALAYLYMAMETLTPVATDAALAAHGGNRSALCKAWNVLPKTCPKCGEVTGIGNLDAEVRRRVLFEGNDALYKDAKRASDGFEHGFASFDDVHSSSLTHRNELGRLVRTAIIDALSLEPEDRDKLLGEPLSIPLPAVRIAKYVRATLMGEPTIWAMEGEAYPGFRLESSITAVETDAVGRVTMQPSESLTPLLAPGVVASDLRLEMWAPPGANLAPPEQTQTPLAPPQME